MAESPGMFGNRIEWDYRGGRDLASCSSEMDEIVDSMPCSYSDWRDVCGRRRGSAGTSDIEMGGRCVSCSRRLGNCRDGESVEDDRLPRSPLPAPRSHAAEPTENCTGKFKRVGGGWMNRVTLNVGGQIFETSTETLSSDSQSMLAAKVARHMTDKDEIIWIDRDPLRFGHVLNYLRSQSIWLEEVGALRAVQEEADFFNLSGLHRICEEKIQKILLDKDEHQAMAQDIYESKGTMKSILNEISGTLKAVSENHRTNRKEQISGVRRRRLDYANSIDHPIFRMDEDF